MKKIMILCAALAYTFMTHAYEIGDIIPQGTWNAVVVWVDESGEHGLMMTQDHALNDYYIEEAAKRAGISKEDMIASLPMPILMKGEKQNKITKIHKQMLKENLNGTNGEQNATMIADYCEHNGLAMETYFPEAYWASSLGEGWFIPGTEELELFAEAIALGVGKQQYTSRANQQAYKNKTDSLKRKMGVPVGLKERRQKRKDISKALQNGEEVQSVYWFPLHICSSVFTQNKTFKKDKSNKGKIAKRNGDVFKISSYIDESIYYGLSHYYLPGWKHSYMFNAKNARYNNPNFIYAFKRF